MVWTVRVEIEILRTSSDCPGNGTTLCRMRSERRLGACRRMGQRINDIDYGRMALALRREWAEEMTRRETTTAE